MKFYTNVQTWGNNILYRGYSNGKREQSRVGFQPTLFISSDTGNYITNDGKKADPMPFKDIKSAKNFLYDYSNSNINIYGMRRFEYSFIDENFEDDIEFEYDQIKIFRIDIEVGSENGFPSPESALEEITAITIKYKDIYHVFGIGDFVPHRNDIKYYYCENELELINKFLAFWCDDHPDIVTGWNISGFDIPYLYNRIENVMGETIAKKLSPWGITRKTSNEIRGYKSSSYILFGISIMDSMDLYQRYSPKGQSQDSYTLDNIGFVELSERKMDYSEYGDLHNLYKKNYQKYLEYNIRDVELDERIENKYGTLNLALIISYMNKCNYEDTFKQVRMWAAIVNRVLLQNNIVINFGIRHNAAHYEGGFVLDPQIGMFEDVASFDLKGLYPHLQIQYNISPETLVHPKDYNDELRKFISQVSVESLLNQDIDTSILEKYNMCITPNGQLFRKDFQGFLPKILEKMIEQRDYYKKLQLETDNKSERESDPIKRKSLEETASRYKSYQMALKVCLNSAYGAIGSEYFVLFDIRLASAITSAGRLAVQWVGKHTNSFLQKTLKTKKNYLVAQDTDSMYLVLKDLTDKLNHKNADRMDILRKICDGPINEEIEKYYKKLAIYTNAFQQMMQMKREKIADKAFWIGKKRYALNVFYNENVKYSEPKIDITGIESVRSSTPVACRNAIQTFIEIVLRGDNDQAIKFIEDFKVRHKELPIDEIALPTGVRGMEKYYDSMNIWSKGAPMHVKAALVYNNYLRVNNLEQKYEFIKEGNKIKYVPLTAPNKVNAEAIAWEKIIPEELDIERFIDYNALFKRTFSNPAEHILKCIGWRLDNNKTLANFFQ